MIRDLKHSGRRAFLKGAGAATLALPLLEYTHGHAFAAGTGPKRFINVFSHGGCVVNLISWPFGYTDGSGDHHGMNYWTAVDASTNLGVAHAPLEPFRAKVNVIRGVNGRAAIAQDPYGQGEHRIANVTALTCATIDEYGEGDSLHYEPRLWSLDYEVAERLAASQPTRFERIHLKVHGHDYGTPFYHGPGEPSSPFSDPREAFATLFEGVTPSGAPDPSVLRRLTRRRSVIDGVLGMLEELRGRVSSADSMRIEAHLDHLRAIERSLEELDLPPMCLPPDAPSVGGDDGGDLVGPIFADMLVAALRCGLTNVANFEISDILTPWAPSGLQVDSAFGIGHSLHHIGRDVGATGPSASLHDCWLTEMRENRWWRFGLMARVLEGLDDPLFAEGELTMLDNSLVYFTSEFSNGSQHLASDALVVTAGSLGGAIRTGEHIDYNLHAGTMLYESNESLGNLYVAFLNALGETDTTFGDPAYMDHTGPVPNLLT